MAFQIGSGVGAIAVELVGGFHYDSRTGLSRSRAVLVDTALDPHMDALRVLASERGWTSSPVYRS